MKARTIQTKVFLPPDLVRELDERARRLKVSKSELARAAIASWLSADGAEQREAAVSRRLDRIGRALERLERDVQIANEAHALFIRAWLTATPPLPEPDRLAAEAKGREGYTGFLEALGRRLAGQRSLAHEVLEERARGTADREDGP